MDKLLDKINVVVLSFVVLSLSVIGILMPDKEFSDMENRQLMEAPKLNSKKLASGEYTGALGKYVAEQFPFRDWFIGVKAYSELTQLKCENNGVVYTAEALISKPKNDISRLSENLMCIDYFAKQNNLSITVAPIPRTADVFSEFLPVGYPKNNDYNVWVKFRTEAASKEFEFVDLYDSLCDSNAFYRTDHHYTTEGAYLTYKHLGKSLGYTPYAVEYFNIQCASDSFSGTSMRTSGFYLYKTDEIHLYRYDGDTEYSVVADGNKAELYDFDKLRQTDKYAVFLGGNHARVDITSGAHDRERLLVIRDSFADSLAPFLALHFDVTLIDLRYFTDSVAEVCREKNINKVLILENMDELCSARNLSYLRMK